MNRIKTLAKEGGWIIFGQILTVTASLLLVRILTEHLDSAQYGQLALGLTIAALVNQVFMGGIISGIGRFYSIAAEKQELQSYLIASRYLITFATVGVLFTGLILISGLLWFQYTSWIGLGIVILIFSIINGYNGSLSAIQNAARQRAVVAFLGSLDGWLKILFVLGVIFWLGNSTVAVVIGYALAALFVAGFQLIFLKRLIKYPLELHNTGIQWVKQIWAYSWPMAAGGLFNWGYYASQRWALELFTSSADVGCFYALTQISYSPISMVAGIFMSFLTPILFARAGSALDNSRLRNLHQIVIRIALLGLGFTFFIASVSFFMHDFIFRWLVADSYRQVSFYMPYIILAAGILSVSQALGVIIILENKTVRILRLATIGNGIIIALNFCFTYLWGLEGLIGSMVLGAAIHCFWTVSLVLENINRIKLKIL